MNDYYNHWLKCSELPEFDRAKTRDVGIRNWGFAIPNDEAIAAIAKHGPVLEVMAGSGYWSKLLADAGCDIVAADDYSWKGTVRFVFGQHFPVTKGDAVKFAARESTRSLLMVWPYMDKAAERVVRSYMGSTICLVSEGHGGCCGTDGMFEALLELYDLVEEVGIPQWPLIHDYLSIYRRKTGDTGAVPV